MKVPLGERRTRSQRTASGQTGADVAVSPQFGHLAETDMVENLAIAGSKSLCQVQKGFPDNLGGGRGFQDLLLP